MSPENREAMLECAQALSEADMPWAASTLQHIADTVGAGDESTIYWLCAATHMCEAIWNERLPNGTGANLRRVNDARSLCSNQWLAAIDRRAARAA